MLRLEFRAMGSKMLSILDSDESDASWALVNQVPAWFEQWEKCLSRFRNDSELTRLNANSGVPHSVSETLWAVLAASLEAEELTDGLVNPLVLQAVVRAGYDRTFDTIEAVSTGAASPEPVDWGPASWPEEPLPPASSIVLDAERRVIRVPEGTGLDFGGVAKGWAAYEAARRLSALAPALVSAGGDVAVSGPRASGEPWRVSVEDPRQRDRYLEMIYLEQGGVATSGKDHRNWIRGGAFQHHIIDPRTLAPAATDILAATVVASTVMRAEALAKAVLIAGSAAGLQLMDEHADAEALLVLEDGRMRYSRNMGYYL